MYADGRIHHDAGIVLVGCKNDILFGVFGVQSPLCLHEWDETRQR
jgi:hypothetical protein